jgi:hypothetical protein
LRCDDRERFDASGFERLLSRRGLGDGAAAEWAPKPYKQGEEQRRSSAVVR